jgi:hypothetical protein
LYSYFSSVYLTIPNAPAANNILIILVYLLSLLKMGGDIDFNTFETDYTDDLIKKYKSKSLTQMNLLNRHFAFTKGYYYNVNIPESNEPVHENKPIVNVNNANNANNDNNIKQNGGSNNAANNTSNADNNTSNAANNLNNANKNNNNNNNNDDNEFSYKKLISHEKITIMDNNGSKNNVITFKFLSRKGESYIPTPSEMHTCSEYLDIIANGIKNSGNYEDIVDNSTIIDTFDIRQL